MFANKTDNNDAATVNSKSSSSTNTKRTRRETFLVNEVSEKSISMSSFQLPPILPTSKRRVTSGDWKQTNILNGDEPPSLPQDFSFTDISLEDDYHTSALRSFDSCQNELESSSERRERNHNKSFDLDYEKIHLVDNWNNKATFCTPTDLDVLLGRGGLTNSHPGNIRYREEVEKVKPMYGSCLTKTEKKEVSELLVAYVQDYGGRFLAKDPDTGQWMLASANAARKKASQALRETKWKQGTAKKENRPD